MHLIDVVLRLYDIQKILKTVYIGLNITIINRTKMLNFFVQPYRSVEKPYPKGSIIFTTDYWDDYGYVTKFHVSYKVSETDYIPIGEIKIGFFGQKSAYELKCDNEDITKHETRNVLSGSFPKLGSNFFSLGQSPEYYENMYVLFKEKTEDVLGKLNDLSLYPHMLSAFEEQGVVSHSLLRSVDKWQIKNQFHQIINGRDKLTDFSFIFNYRNKNLEFKVEALSNPPTNIHVLIGRNGAGKTTILNSMTEELLKNSESSKLSLPQNFSYSEDNGEGFFSKVIYISYNVFGNYVPKFPKAGNFSYIGLKEKTEDIVTIKNIDSLYAEFSESLSVIHSSTYLHTLFQKVLVNICESYDQTVLYKIQRGIPEKERFNSIDFKDLSSGHAIVLLVIINLIANVTEKTLILFDEPETHLHPPLLSALVRSINFILTEKNGICIFATHSPVLIQEIPRSCVQIIRRVGESVGVSRPELESFGENVSTLTHEIFSLEVKNSGFYKLMKKIFVDMDGDVERIIEEFNDELGSEAINLLYLLKHNDDKNNLNKENISQ